MNCLHALVLAGLLGYCGTTAAWATEPSETGEGDQGSAGSAYSLGVFPYLTPLRMEAIYAPVSEDLRRALGHPVLFRTASRFEVFFERLKAQRYDIAVIQPFWYVPAVDRFGSLPLARMTEPLTTQIMVLDSSSLSSTEDLRGTTVATPPAFAPVTHIARKALEERGMVPGRDVVLKAFKSIDSCFQQVVIGAASACVSGSFAPRIMEKELKVKLRALIKTPGIPNVTIVIHSRVPATVRERLRQAVLSWHSNNDGRALLQRIGTSQFVPARDADYDVVRALVREFPQQ